MSHKRTLEVFARLHLDREFRAAFTENPRLALATAGLNEAEYAGLAALDPVAVERMGRMYDFHRLARVQENIPWLDLGSRPDLGPVARRFLDESRPRLLNRDDAVAFCEYVEACPPTEPPYLGELARYERLRISLAWQRDGRGRLRASFAFPVLRILESLGSPGWPEVPRIETEVELVKVPHLPAVIAHLVTP